jgi:hypothetical protein
MSEGMEAMMPILRKNVDRITERAQQEIADMMKDSPKKTRDVAPPTKN